MKKDSVAKPGHLVNGLVYLDQTSRTREALSLANRRVNAIRKMAAPVNLGWKTKQQGEQK